MTAAQIPDVAATIRRGDLVRMVIGERVIVDRFYGLDKQRGAYHVGYSSFMASKVIRLERVTEPSWEDMNKRVESLPIGLLPLLGGVDGRAFMTEGAARVALIGLRTVLEAESRYRFGLAPSDAATDLPAMAEILRPMHLTGPVGWRSIMVPASSEILPDLGGTSLAILDGSVAISTWLREVPVPLVVAVLDRSSRSAANGALAIEQSFGKGTSLPLSTFPIRLPDACEALAFADRRPVT